MQNEANYKCAYNLSHHQVLAEIMQWKTRLQYQIRIHPFLNVTFSWKMRKGAKTAVLAFLDYQVYMFLGQGWVVALDDLLIDQLHLDLPCLTVCGLQKPFQVNGFCFCFDSFCLIELLLFFTVFCLSLLFLLIFCQVILRKITRILDVTFSTSCPYSCNQ